MESSGYNGSLSHGAGSGRVAGGGGGGRASGARVLAGRDLPCGGGRDGLPAGPVPLVTGNSFLQGWHFFFVLGPVIWLATHAVLSAAVVNAALVRYYHGNIETYLAGRVVAFGPRAPWPSDRRAGNRGSRDPGPGDWGGDLVRRGAHGTAS